MIRNDILSWVCLSFGKLRTALALSVAAFAAAANAAPVVFSGANLGLIPDGPLSPCGTAIGERNVTFAVTGVATPLNRLTVRIAFAAPGHPWGGDLSAELIAPDGVTKAQIFERLGATTTTSAGSGVDLLGPYEFDDFVIASFSDLASSGLSPIPAGKYRASENIPGPFGTPASISMLSKFGSLTNAQLNGTWTLKFTDVCAVDTASVSLAELIIDSGPPPQPSPEYSISTTALNLGRVRTNTTSEERFIELSAPTTNSGPVGFQNGSCSIGGPDATMFQATLGAISIAAGTTERIGVRFRPSSDGEKTATLTCTNAQPSGVIPASFSVTLQGVGGTPLPKPNCYDVDGDGQMNALTDGLFIARLQLGFSPSDAANGIVFNAPRSSLKLVGEFMRSQCGFDF